MTDDTIPPPEDDRRGAVAPIAIEEELQRSYLSYAMSVIVARALPDARDGLKPVHRRILFSMNEQGHASDRPYVKSARVVGDVMGKYHPHGDLAIYESLVRMAQPFSMGLMLIDGQGNFGSIDADPPAQMRYTECRLTKAAEALMADIDADTVDFKDNYDGKEREPVVLPARIPNLLVNGSGGIAVGMATNIPPHNLGEVVDACLAMIADPQIPLEALCEFVPGPDFPTGGEIIGRGGARQALMTGRGPVIVRGAAEIEEQRGGREAIVISSVPYQVNKAALCERIGELAREKRIEGISELRDESDRQGLRVVIELKRDASAGSFEVRMIWITSSMLTTAIARPTRVWPRSRALASSNLVRRTTTSSRNATKAPIMSRSVISCGRPWWSASVLTPNEVCRAVNR